MCFSIAKYLLFAFNFVFWLAGCALLGVGIWLNVDPTIAESIAILESNAIHVGAFVLIAAGAIMLVVGFFGCCGAIKESTCLLGTYFGFLFVVFILEVAIGIFAFVSYDSIDELVTTVMEEFDLMSVTSKDDCPLCTTQQNLKCCGTTTGCQDWNGNPLGSLNCVCDNAIESEGTCVLATAAQPACAADSSVESNQYVYREDCSSAMTTFLQDNLTIIGAVGLAIGLAEVIGMIVAMCLCCSIKKDKERGV